MAVIALTSASGSPGVTTTALALALAWPRPVIIIDADPTGGSAVLAGFLRGMVEYDAGLIELALSPLDVADALVDVVRPLCPPETDVGYVAGIRAHTQAGALRDLWEPLAVALADLDASGQDVIVDAGRLGLAGSPTPLLETADLTLLVTRADLPSLSAARSWADVVRRPGTGWRNGGLLLIGEGQPYRATEVTKVLGMAVVTDLPADPAAAAVYHRGAAAPRHFETGPYVRATASAVESIRAHLARTHLSLVEGGAR